MEQDKWNDRLEIEGDARDSFEANLETDEEIAEYERWLDEAQPIGHCPKCGANAYTREGFCGVCEIQRL